MSSPEFFHCLSIIAFCIQIHVAQCNYNQEEMTQCQPILKGLHFSLILETNDLLRVTVTLATPSSQPRITWPCPMVKLKGFPRVLEESNCDPFVSVPAQTHTQSKPLIIGSYTIFLVNIINIKFFSPVK